MYAFIVKQNGLPLIAYHQKTQQEINELQSTFEGCDYEIIEEA